MFVSTSNALKLAEVDTSAKAREFYQLPKFLFKGNEFKKMSLKAKLAYSFFMNRLKLSVKNKWTDNENNVFIVFTNAELAKELNCSVVTAIKTINELKNKKLIKTKRQGQGKPNLIFLCKVVKVKEQEEQEEIDTSTNPVLFVSNVSNKNSENSEVEEVEASETSVKEKNTKNTSTTSTYYYSNYSNSSNSKNYPKKKNTNAHSFTNYEQPNLDFKMLRELEIESLKHIE